MKRLVMIGMFGLLLSGCGDADIDNARIAVKQQLSDPGSAEFRNEKVYHAGGDVVVCGELNAKNRLGGYSGYGPYVVEGVNTFPSVKFSADNEIEIKITCQLAEKNDRLKQ